MLEYNLTPKCQKIVKNAHSIAKKLDSSNVNCFHFLMSFIDTPGTIVFDFLSKEKFDIDKEKKDILEFISKNTGPKDITPNLLEAADELSKKFKSSFIDFEHLFLSMFDVAEDVFFEYIHASDIHLEIVASKVEESLTQNAIPAKEGVNSNKESEQESGRKYLRQYALCLNELAYQGKLGVLHVNKNHIQNLSEILCRKNKNNPLILGEAGVGKTALVESLVLSIVKQECSDFILHKQVYSIDLASMISGCKYRGDFEEKIKNLLKEASEDENVILFIDEIHTIVGGGNSENGMDIANILKPYLARGEISCIGATTFDEYRKTIASDPALSRRFQVLKVEEPNKVQTLELLKTVKNSFEEFHMVIFEEEILKYIVDVADKYLSGRFPDKAVDLLDQTGSRVKLEIFKKSPEMQEVEVKILSLIPRDGEPSPAQRKKIEILLKKLDKMIKTKVLEYQKNIYRAKEKDILQTVSNKTGIPIEELEKKDFEKLAATKENLNKNIIGQEDQIEKIYSCLLRAKAGFRDAKRPICSILFLGPTGVGKTYTAKLIAENLFTGSNSFVRIDMSEYTEETSVKKLYGSDPGYVGYEEGGVLTEKLKKNPYSIILFDEIQKAHPKVLSSLEQIIEEGKVTDSYGNTVDFSNTVILMTTNVGNDIVFNKTIGFADSSKTLKEFNVENDFKILKSYFSYDFLNRLDEIVCFKPLSETNTKTIITNNLKSLEIKVKEVHDIKITFGEDVVDFVFSKIKFENFGARQVSKTIQRELENKIAKHLLSEEKPSKLQTKVENGEIMVII